MTSTFTFVYKLFFTLSFCILLASHIQCASTKDTAKPDTQNEAQQSSTAKPAAMPQFNAEEFIKTCKPHEEDGTKMIMCHGVVMTFQNVMKNADAASTGDLKTVHQNISKLYLDGVLEESKSTVEDQDSADALFPIDSINQVTKKVNAVVANLYMIQSEALKQSNGSLAVITVTHETASTWFVSQCITSEPIVASSKENLIEQGGIFAGKCSFLDHVVLKQLDDKL